MSVLPVLLACAALASAARSPDGRLRWDPGEDSVTVVKRGGFSSRGQRIRLPELEKGATRTVVFSNRGDRFGVLDQASDEVGLHAGSPRGARGAAALVTGAVLRLMDLKGRVLWTKRLPDTYSVGRGASGSEPLTVAADGTSAVLMQDSDPYTKEKPLVVVFDSKGRETMRLDYTAWSRVDDLRLSEDGTWLALRGIGRLQADDAWGSALGHYRLADGDRTVLAVGGAAGGRSLRGFDGDGRVCCLVEGKALAAYAHDGARTTLTPAEAAALFGPEP